MKKLLTLFNRNKQKFSSPFTVLPVQHLIGLGVFIVVFFMGAFFLWAAIAPLESAALASGQITVDTYRKKIQHLEGGIIKKIYIREGSVVKAGDLLVQLEDTQPRAVLDLIENQTKELTTREARLIAERNGHFEIVFPKDFQNSNNSTIKKLIENQNALFTIKHKTFASQLEILGQQITQLDREIDSLNSQVAAESEQLELLEEEIKAVSFLEQKRLIEKPRLLALKRERARLVGNRGEHLGLIAKARQKINEIQTQRLMLTDKNQKDILQELQTTQLELANLSEKRAAALDILKRTEIRATQEGTVVSLQEHTIGGVLKPGEEILEIVPNKDKLVVEAKIDPMDIDIVHPGLIAKVQLRAYKQRITPSIEGTVENVSADSLRDPHTNHPYYLARINIDHTQLAQLQNIKLYPGMPAEVMIIIDKRTPLSYFLGPIYDSFHHAFRES